MAKGFWTWLPGPWDKDAGRSPKEAINPPINTGLNLSRIVSIIASSLLLFSRQTSM
jgi:hypothetical protein